MNSICNIHQDHNRMSTATKTKLGEVFVEEREFVCVSASLRLCVFEWVSVCERERDRESGCATLT